MQIFSLAYTIYIASNLTLILHLEAFWQSSTQTTRLPQDIFTSFHLNRLKSAAMNGTNLSEAEMERLHGSYKADTECFLMWLVRTENEQSCPGSGRQITQKNYTQTPINKYCKLANFISCGSMASVGIPYTVKQALLNAIRDRQVVQQHYVAEHERTGCPHCIDIDTRHEVFNTVLEVIHKLLDKMVVDHGNPLVSNTNLAQTQQRNIYYTDRGVCRHHHLNHNSSTRTQSSASASANSNRNHNHRHQRGRGRNHGMG